MRDQAKRWLLALAAAALMTGAERAQAQSVEDFYRGKQVRIIVSFDVGNDYDQWARLLARHLGRHVPGNPTFVVQNMPGAGGAVAAAHLYNVAAKDGTVVKLVALRRELLAHRTDFQQVLDVLVEKGDWGKPMPRGKGRGIAIHESYDSIVGMIAEVAVANGEVKVERVVIACDCGVVVNPRGVETQLEGGMIYGLSAALFGEITVKNGRVEQGNFDTYPVVCLKDAPKTEVYITPTPGKKWGGVGEPGATMIQPAVTNAIFAATGKRLRALPIKGQYLSGAA
jgi:CO/xanthine dehydrogenase Mo-binding subunit